MGHKNTFRLSVSASSSYAALYDDGNLSVGTLSGVGDFAFTTVGDGDLEFDVYLPVERVEVRDDLRLLARSVLSQIVEMDEQARTARKDDPYDDDEVLANVTVREYFVEFEYYATAWNSQWSEFFTRDPDGRWRHRGLELPWMHTWRVKTAPQILLLDAAYSDAAAAAAGILMPRWDADAPTAVWSKRIDEPPRAYEPGQFYKRELPVLMSLIDDCPLPVSEIVIDGYVWLSDDGRAGLGAHLYEALARKVPVIGVAKTKFRDDAWSQPVRRGASESPLYVTAAGIDRSAAATRVARMSGVGRIPTLLKAVDDAARSALA